MDISRKSENGLSLPGETCWKEVAKDCTKVEKDEPEAKAYMGDGT